MNATRAAVEEGIVPGGGVAMLRAIKSLDGIKADAEGYVKQLTTAHAVMIAAMKCKQTTDLQHPKRLHDLLHAFQASYLQK